ncbi:hypothetical protein D918_05483 [Trichuris suis]|nr:hypothetical protein D918_05483 [Trichuris suis]
MTKLSLQLDESTLPGNEALLLAYVRFIKAEQLSVLEFFADHDIALHENVMKREYHIAYLAELYSYVQLGARRIPSISKSLLIERKRKVQDGEVEVYCQHVETMHQDFSVHYEDIIAPDVPIWAQFHAAGRCDSI